MYVPTGFPHTTDTCTTLQHETIPPTGTLHPTTTPDAPPHRYDETSIHLTMGLETHVWALAYAHLRWALLQRCGKKFAVRIPDDNVYWSAMDTITVGFLAGSDWNGGTGFVHSDNEGEGEGEGEGDNCDGYASGEQIAAAVNGLKEVMVRLEPERWSGAGGNGGHADRRADRRGGAVHGEARARPAEGAARPVPRRQPARRGDDTEGVPGDPGDGGDYGAVRGVLV